MGHVCALLLGKMFARLDEENLRPVLESILDPSQQIRFELFLLSSTHVQESGSA